MKKNTMDDSHSAYDYLLDVLCEQNDKKYIIQLFNALLTEKEHKEIDNRVRIFTLLQQGLTQREISAQLGVGIATVSRGAKAFHHYRVNELLPNLTDNINK